VSQPADTSKDSALREVGRTVVNFQRLEYNLKLAARLGPLQGTFQNIREDTARRQKRAESSTLGHAIQAWLKYYDGSEAVDAWTPDLFDFSVRMTFTLESDVESREAHAAALSALLETRNHLVHTRLARFPWDSPAECESLIGDLASVNAAISEQLDYVTSLMAQIVAAQKESAEAVMGEVEAATQMPKPSLERP
jgi:hypothetical protein